MKAASEITRAAAALFTMRRMSAFAAPIALAAFALLTAAAGLACGASDVVAPNSAAVDAVASPAVPTVPVVPTVPTVPAVPAVPTVPTVPAVPTAPTVPAVPAVEDIMPPGTMNSIVADLRKLKSAGELAEDVHGFFSVSFGCYSWLSSGYTSPSEWDAYCVESSDDAPDNIAFAWNSNPYFLGTSFDNADIVHRFQTGDFYFFYAASGDFDFNELRKRLWEGGYGDEEYMGAEIFTGDWDEPRPPDAVIDPRDTQIALYEDAKMFIVATTGDHQYRMQALIDAIARGEGAAAAQRDDLQWVREKVGGVIYSALVFADDGLCAVFREESAARQLNCVAWATSITEDGKTRYAFVFTSEADAALGAELLTSDAVYYDIQDIQVDGDALSYTLAERDPQNGE